jgi:hypothetical protein
MQVTQQVGGKLKRAHCGTGSASEFWDQAMLFLSFNHRCTAVLT